MNWELRLNHNGKWTAFLCDDRDHCDRVWDEQVRLLAGEPLYGAIGYTEETDTAGVVRFRVTGSRSTAGFAGF